jgi:copper chaperone CopZ
VAQIRKLPGVTGCDADFGRDRLVVRYDPAVVSRDRLLEAIAGLGYRPRVVREP